MRTHYIFDEDGDGGYHVLAIDFITGRVVAEVGHGFDRARAGFELRDGDWHRFSVSQNPRHCPVEQARAGGRPLGRVVDYRRLCIYAARVY